VALHLSLGGFGLSLRAVAMRTRKSTPKSSSSINVASVSVFVTALLVLAEWYTSSIRDQSIPGSTLLSCGSDAAVVVEDWVLSSMPWRVKSVVKVHVRLMSEHTATIYGLKA
jgi:hypothetical protein